MNKSPEVLSHAAWLDARQRLLDKEKQLTRLRDEITRERRTLPWEKVERNYVFEGPPGAVPLGELFEGRSQLIIYHFMFGPDWRAGCRSCSFLADHFVPAIVHLNQRDVSMVAVSRAPVERLQAFKARMGWTLTWVSSLGSDFNRDFYVHFSEDAIAAENCYYNYRTQRFPSTEAPGASVFYKDSRDEIFHTYSVYGRGLDMFITAYHLLDIVPKGRDEDGLSFTMEWVRLHDEYDI